MEIRTTHVDTILTEYYQSLKAENKSRLQHVEQAMEKAEELFYARGAIQVVKSHTLTVPAINQITLEEHKAQIHPWEIQGQQVHFNTELVDTIKEVTENTVTIFQRIPEGFLRIATNILNSDGSRAVNYYIPNRSPVAASILRHENYRGSAFVVNDWYLTAYNPIIQEDQLIGMFYVGVPEMQAQAHTKYIQEEFLELVDFILHADQKDTQEILARIVHYFYKDRPMDGPGAILELAMKQFARLLVAQNRANKTLPLVPAPAPQGHVSQAGDYLRQHYQEELDIEKLADMVHMSVPTFFRAFKTQFGTTPLQYLHEQRIRVAREMLKNPEMSVADACFALGYSNTSYFIKTFKSQIGLTPKQYQLKVCKQ
ncbi:MAG: Cache 3/Cache 2 fusion domain-containing protein [Nitritalea sp.]